VIATPTLVSYLIVSAALLGIGIYGLTVKRNAIRILFAIELIVNAANLNFVAFTRYMSPPQVSGQVIVFYSIAVAAMEAAVGLALILVAFRLNSTIDVRKLNKLKG
jgi:NADH:ubiquinone oxidoreductase subunit K